LNADCFNKAIRYLTLRPHATGELAVKLRRRFPAADISQTIQKLKEIGYLDDAVFARNQTIAMQRKRFGPRRARQELIRRGIDRDLAVKVTKLAYAQTDTAEMARELVRKNLPRLRKLPPETARRRLIGVLARRGFDEATIRAAIGKLPCGSDPD
jgi:regulatory protein